MKTPYIYFWSNLAQFFLEWEMFQKNIVQGTKLHILRSVSSFFENSIFYAIVTQILYNIEKKIFYSRTGHGRQYGECTFHTGHLKLQTHTQNV